MGRHLETDGGTEAPAPAQVHGAPAAHQPAKAAAPADSGTPAAPGGPVLATPATRKLARDLGVDIRSVAGTGRAGRVTSDDVKAHGEGTAPAAAPAAAKDLRQGEGTRIPFRGLRRKIAEALARSKFTAPHATYVEEIDCTELVALRAKLNAKLVPTGVKLSFLPLIIKATVAALKKFPQMNAMLDEDASEIIQWQRLHIGLATATENGLVVPVIRDADRKSLTELAREIERLADATRTGKAAREDLVGSTFTITSLGAWGGVMATAIINPPEVAILGVHRIARRPAVVGDKIEIRELMNLSLSFDHRVVDGFDAAQFVAEIKRALEAPAHLAAEVGAQAGVEAP